MTTIKSIAILGILLCCGQAAMAATGVVDSPTDIGGSFTGGWDLVYTDLYRYYLAFTLVYGTPSVSLTYEVPSEDWDSIANGTTCMARFRVTLYTDHPDQRPCGPVQMEEDAFFLKTEEAPTFQVTWVLSPTETGCLVVHAQYDSMALWSQLAGKAINPTPADGSGPGVDFTDLTFSWENPYWPQDYNVYVGPGAESLTLVAESHADANYVTSLMELATIWGQDPIDSIIYWRVDSRFGASVVTGDVWSFDPRPEEAGTSNVFGTSPTPLVKADLQMIMIIEGDD